MLAVQALINAALFGFAAYGFLDRGASSIAFLTFAMLTALFVVSAAIAAPYRRLALVSTWVIAIFLLSPHLPLGLMDGLFVSVWIFAYLLAGLVGACLLPLKDSPTRGAPL